MSTVATNPDLQLAVIDGRPAIVGEFDIRSGAHVVAWLATFDDSPLEVDLSGVTFFDSSALRSMLPARRYNGGIRVVNPSRAVMRVLEVTGTAEWLMDGRGPPR